MRTCPSWWLVILAAWLPAVAPIRAETVDIFPLPQQVTFTDTALSIGGGAWHIAMSPGSENLTDLAADRIKSAFADHGLAQPAIVTTGPISNAIFLGTVSAALPELGAGIQAAGCQADGSDLEVQGYTLVFDEAARNVYILGKDPHGALYGVTTLEQLFKGQGGSAYFIGAEIQDWPDIKCRVLGSVQSFPYWDSSPEATATFKSSFTPYLNNVLIPRKINAITMARGGFKYHTEPAESAEITNRMAWAVAEAERHGMVVEYHDNMACAWADVYPLRTNGVAPYDEIIWDNSHSIFYCYTRTNMIRQVAGDMGRFMADMGVSMLYCHTQDNGWENCWLPRCSQCRARWPSSLDDDHAAFAQAQANLANIYYDEIKKYVPDLDFTMVQRHYTGGYPEYQAALHTNLLYPDIRILIREQPQSVVNEMRSHYPGRALYAHVFEGRGELQWAPIFQMTARFNKDYDYGNDRDVLLGWYDGLMRSLDQATFAYYCWNTDAPGGQISTNRAQLFNPRRDVEAMPAAAQASLDIIAKFDYGRTLGPKVLAAFATWASPGLMADPDHIFDRSWLWDNVTAWFPEVDGMPAQDAKTKITELHLAETQRARTLIENFVDQNGIPEEVRRAYGGFLKADLLAAPRYWEFKARASNDQADYRAGLKAVRYAITNKYPGYAQTVAQDWRSNQGFGVVCRPEQTLEDLEAWFLTRAVPELTAVAVSASQVDLTWLDTGSGEENWKIRRSRDGVTWTNAVYVLPADSSSYSDTGLDAATTYYYKVKWETAAGDGPYTAPVSATTALDAEPATWVAYNDPAWESFQTTSNITTVSRAEKGLLAEHDTGLPIPVLLTIDDGGNGPFPSPSQHDHLTQGTDAYELFHGRVDTDGHISYGGANLTLTISGLQAVPAYEVVLYGNRNIAQYADRLTRVTITNAAGFSNTSSAGAVFGGQSDPSVVIANGYNNAGYVARFSNVDPGSDGQFELIVDDGGSASPPKFYVSAFSMSRAPVTAPAMPGNLSAVAVADNRVELRWQDNSEWEQNFKIRRSTNDLDYSHAVIVPANTTVFTDTGLAPGTTYYYKIQAEHATLGDSPYTAPVNTTTALPTAPFVAYNDLAWAAGQHAANITTYTRAQQGLLVDYASGKPVGALLTINGGGAAPGVIQGANAAAGTDAHAFFDGRVDCAGLISYGANPLVLTFNALDTGAVYELVMFGNRDHSAYTYRYTTVTISGVPAFTNVSSAGAQSSTTTMPADTVRICNGDNTANGYVARFDHIVPGPQGNIVVTVSDTSGYFYLNALMLQCRPPLAQAGNGATWRYRKGTGEASSPVTAWRRTTFDDSGWSSGDTPFGYSGAGWPAGTELADMRGNYSCVFMRKTIQITDPALCSEVRLEVAYDDGFVMWINEQEVARVNVDGQPGSFVPYDSCALSNRNATYSGVLTGPDMPGLIKGSNVVAVQTFNRSLADSSDLIMQPVLTVVGRSFSVARDRDQDGIPDAWEILLCATDATLQTDNDYDNDGLSDLQEFIAGTDPTTNADCFAVNVGLSADGLLVSFPARTADGPGYAALSRHYALERNAGPQPAGGWLPVTAAYADIVPATPGTISYTNASQPNAFYRARTWLETN